MAEKKMTYTDRNYQDCRNDILSITKKYYSDVFGNLNDASVGAWFVDLLSDIYDNLNYHIDRTYQETNINSAERFASLLDIARTNGLKVPYKKAALVEIELSCQIPVFNHSNGDLSEADERYCPYIKKGSQFSNGEQTFELVADVDFKEQFGENGISNRQIIPDRDSNGNIVSYTYKKLAIASASNLKVFKMALMASDIKPFMEVEIQDNSVIGIESILFKDGSNITNDPQLAEFYVDEEEFFDKANRQTTRFFEVESLVDQYRFGYDHKEPVVISSVNKGDMHLFPDEITTLSDNTTEVRHKNYYNPIWDVSEIFTYETRDENNNTIITNSVPIRKVVRGKWKRLKNKFITEYTDNWKLKVIFGAGIKNKYGDIPDEAVEFTKYQMSRMTANDYMGVLPNPNSTMFILYRVGGGEISNIAAGTLTSIISLNIEIDGDCNDANNATKARNVKDSITVTNTTPSYGGKDEPTAEELRYLIKYNSAAQNRCVTVKDYYAMISKIPAKYGCPFRIGVVEENNKVVIYSLGLDYLGKLTNFLAETVAENIKEYLSMYKMINDFVEIRSGKIFNVSFKITVYLDKTYDKSDVTKNIINATYDYMDVRKHLMGEDIYLGDLQKEISKLDGVINLVSLQCYNKVGEGYSEDSCTQELKDPTACMPDEQVPSEEDYEEIDLEASDYILFSEANSMFEIKNKNTDIVVVAKVRQ